MRTFRYLMFLMTVVLILAASPLFAQQLLTNIPVGVQPWKIAVNTATNKIYVANEAGASITVIDGATNNTTTFALPNIPEGLAVNPVTNKIYVALPEVGVVIIDGATNNTVTVNDPHALGPVSVAVNTVTNRAYVVNINSANVTVLDGSSDQILDDVPVGTRPQFIALNPVTNKIYVANYHDQFGDTVTVIDGSTDSTSTVTTGEGPDALAVNSVTNLIYVANVVSGTVTVIDGVTNQTTTVTVGTGPTDVGVNAATNKIYVADFGGGIYCDIRVIDGATNNTTTLVDGSGPNQLAVDEVYNQIYFADYEDSTIHVVNGATNDVVTVTVGGIPADVAVNPVTNRAYTANKSQNNVSVIGGAVNLNPLQFVPVAPCRLIDTRLSGGSLPANTSRNFAVPQLGGCGIPSTAAAYSLNVTAVPQGRLGFLTIWPTGQEQPVVSTMNSLDGRIKANAAIVPAGYQGQVSVFVNDTSDVVLDIDGYFTSPGGSTLAFYPLAPCRIVDTRNPVGELGGPFLSQDQQRNFPVLESTCIPQNANAQAYSFNVTAVPHPTGQRLGFLTVWPKGEPQPGVSTLNNVTGTIVANAAIVPSGAGGAISVYPNNDTDLLIDINGYFAAPGTNGLSLYTVAPCRVIDTRQVGNGQPFMNELTVNVMGSQCALPSNAQAYVFNATVVPPGQLGFLTLWADGQTQPNASTLNAKDGAITSNMAVVPTTNGSIDAYANALTQLILDISSYFAP
jgi:YVTN family beta-propeller protein